MCDEALHNDPVSITEFYEIYSWQDGQALDKPWPLQPHRGNLHINLEVTCPVQIIDACASIHTVSR